MTSRPASAPAVVIHLVGGEAAGLLCSALVRAATELQLHVVVVDRDPWGGGADVLLGLEHLPGVRWHDLHGAAGDFDAQGLLDRLPRGPSGERVLAVDRMHTTPDDPRIADNAVQALTAVGDVLVVLTASAETSARLHRPGDQLWVVAGSDVRSCAAGVAAAQWFSQQRLSFMTAVVDDRSKAVTSSSAQEFTRIDRVIPVSRADRRDIERGDLCGRRRWGLGRHARAILDVALAQGGVAA
ncbi:hypothetical protein IEE94_10135 [Yimella sp. cx-573]|nr:hypothetical protein [Yimella sp. cx-573]